eukprot:UN15803
MSYTPRPDYADSCTYKGEDIIHGVNCTRWDNMMSSWFSIEDSHRLVKFSIVT